MIQKTLNFPEKKSLLKMLKFQWQLIAASLDVMFSPSLFEQYFFREIEPVKKEPEQAQGSEPRVLIEISIPQNQDNEKETGS